jgi:hypothetical protein
MPSGLARRARTWWKRIPPLARDRHRPVPTLFKFLVVVAVIGGVGYAGMLALATLVEPKPREMTITIPASRLPAR